MVGVSKKYVKREELLQTIDSMLLTYSKIQVEFPSTVETHFLVKAWSKKAKGKSLGGRKPPSSNRRTERAQNKRKQR